MNQEYSDNLMDLNLDIGLLIQNSQAGNEIDFEQELYAIQRAITKITNRLLK
jgi:hypothetical protein